MAACTAHTHAQLLDMGRNVRKMSPVEQRCEEDANE